VTPQRSRPQHARAIVAAREGPEPLQADARGGVVGNGGSVENGTLYLLVGTRSPLLEPVNALAKADSRQPDGPRCQAVTSGGGFLALRSVPLV
jgi:hypothetical protein